ncbi:hypothetical protein [Methylobacterium nonmethylotrophicum]|uniref:Uncharacterized protein n=1 Tax=Methylobacterium nonmethylotrophicum TaxID=1141884 RepID=A0A4Z0NCU2_9HYPH|nr:hypothetical protein [Methylobacterium nonmethylotrophicum]TGD91916.1 hypothetical protein EU555_35410 [Methylobacterium nonmethylotrophicum]
MFRQKYHYFFVFWLELPDAVAWLAPPLFEGVVVLVGMDDFTGNAGNKLSPTMIPGTTRPWGLVSPICYFFPPCVDPLPEDDPEPDVPELEDGDDELGDDIPPGIGAFTGKVGKMLLPSPLRAGRVV